MSEELDRFLGEDRGGGWAVPPPILRLTIPQGAGPGTPRIIINGTGPGEAGNIVIVGTDEDNRIIIDADGPLGNAILNFQDSDNPGDTTAGVQWVSNTGLVMRANEFTEADFGEDVRPYFLLGEGSIVLGFRKTGAIMVGSSLQMTDFTNSLLRKRADDTTINGVVSSDADAKLLGCDTDGIAVAWVAADENGIRLNAANAADDCIDIQTSPKVSDTRWDEGDVFEGTAIAQTGGTTNVYAAYTTCGKVFIAPPSGKVAVFWGGRLGNRATVINFKSYLHHETREGCVFGAGSVVQGTSDARAEIYDNHSASVGDKYAYVYSRQVIVGLTPGDTYNTRLMARQDTIAGTLLVDERWISIQPLLGEA